MNEIEEIKARLDIVDVVGQYVQLQKAGRTFKAPCPFHNERTPSFIVSPDRQSWHCFGACGTGGDVISFVMRREGLEFGDALRMLAERAGVPLRERATSERQDKERERLFAANEAAARYYHGLLASGEAGKAAREYVERRGVDPATAESFLLGYSLPSWEAARQHLRERGFGDAELRSAGITIDGESGPHDRFHGRLMFAIRDAKGRVIGFGARALDDSQPKYINTSQTALFDKGGMLYALDRAQAGIRREGKAVIVEGYMDAIAAHQNGFDNVVASMGTALTERQVRLLKRLAGEIVLALDADTAGSEATVRGHEVVREALSDSTAAVPVVSWRGLVGYQEAAAIDLKVAVLPAGKDPDEVIRGDPEAWRALIAQASPVLDYRLEAAARTHDLANPRGRSQLVQEFLPLLTAVTDPVVRAHYVQRLSRLAMVNEADLGGMVVRPRGRAQTFRPTASKPPAAPAAGDNREEFLLALLLRYPQLRKDGLDLPEDLLWESENRQLLSAWKQSEESEAVKEAIPLELQAYAERLTQRRLPSFDSKVAREALLDCRRLLERRQMQAEKQAIGALLAEREEEFGAAALAGALEAEVANDELGEAMSLHMRDMEAGLRLHGRENSGGDRAVETRTDG